MGKGFHSAARFPFSFAMPIGILRMKSKELVREFLRVFQIQREWFFPTITASASPAKPKNSQICIWGTFNLFVRPHKKFVLVLDIYLKILFSNIVPLTAQAFFWVDVILIMQIHLLSKSGPISQSSLKNFLEYRNS